MTDDQVRHALRKLPREGAPRGFTQQVLARLDEGKGHPAAPWRRVAVLAAVALVMGALVLVLWPAADGDRGEEAQARLEELRRMHDTLSRELQEIRRLTAQAEPDLPVLYVDGDEEFDLVLDLRSLATEMSPPGTSSSRPQIRPALQR